MKNKDISELKNKDISELKNSDTKYKEVKINKMIVNGKEQVGNVILAEDTAGKQELNVTVFTQEMNEVKKEEKGSNVIYEWLKKSIFHSRRR